MNKLYLKAIISLCLFYPLFLFAAESVIFHYDLKSRITTEEYADGSVVNYVYDNMGNRLLKANVSPSAPENQVPESIFPTPIDNSINIDTNPVLSWTPSSDSDGDDFVYFLYMGHEISNLDLMTSSAETSFSPAAQCLKPDTRYYWQVIVRDSQNSEYQSPVWSFTTKNTHTSNDGSCSLSFEDFDGDGLVNALDELPFNSDETLDSDFDGIGNNSDTDDDNDGLLDSVDLCPLISSSNNEDSDGDGIGDICEVVAKLALGAEHSLISLDDGSLLSWGNNTYGELGDGSYSDRLSPVPVVGISRVIDISVGNHHSLALKPDGTVWAWGHNDSGQLGNGNEIDQMVPVQVYDLFDVIAIKAGANHSLALKSDGTVWAWGDNSKGQLGNGYNENSSLPVLVTNLNNVKQIDSEFEHSLALKTDGTVWSWGANDDGQLGDNSIVAKNTPAQVINLSGIKAVAAGYNHNLALVAGSGEMLAWGHNAFGELGDKTEVRKLTPVSVVDTNEVPLSGVTSIAAGRYHSLAVNSTGKVLTWGYNSSGQLGDGTEIDHMLPIVLAELSDIKDVIATKETSFAIKTDGQIYSWGSNQYGQLSIGTVISRLTPQLLTSLTLDSVNIPPSLDLTPERNSQPGENHSVMVVDDGSLWTWGINNYGQLGDGTQTDRLKPVKVVGLDNIVAAAAGYLHTIALQADGTVWTWGANSYGQLGLDSDIIDINITPARVEGLSGIVAVRAGQFHNLALKKDGTVWSWGKNDVGQLGDSTHIIRYAPVQVSNLFNVIQIDTESDYSLVLKSDGSVWSWGENSDGQLGEGSLNDRNSPVRVHGLDNIQKISTGIRHNLALDSLGGIWAWGNNSSGQLGDSTTGRRTTPVMTIDEFGNPFSNIKDIAAGNHHSLALTSSGFVLSWGSNSDGQLGDGTLNTRYMPTQINGMNNIESIQANSRSSFAINSSGALYSWGDNHDGQLGSGTILDSMTPESLSDLVLSGPVITILDLSAVSESRMGEGHGVVVVADSTVRSWGGNNYGQLGNGKNSEQLSSVKVAGLDNVIASSAGGYHTLALKADGTVWAWGNNLHGQLGIGNTSDQALPVKVIGLSSIVSVRAGQYHSLALRKDGTVWAWGNNDKGQVAYKVYADLMAPVMVANLYGVTQIDTELNHSLALKSDGTVWSWGYNRDGQLGEGSTVSRNSPVRVSGLTNIKQVDAGENHSLALDDNGEIWSWGSNSSGQLGVDTISYSRTPVSVLDGSDNPITGVIFVSAGGSHSLALSSNGSVLSWGRNSYGQLGDGTQNEHSTPTEIPELTNIDTVQAVGDSSFVINTAGELFSWGYNAQGQLGNGTVSDTFSPELLTDMTLQGPVITTLDLTAIKDSRIGESHGIFVTDIGTAWSWGYNFDGQLGEQTYTERLNPVRVTGINNIIAASAGGLHTLVLKLDGTVWSWGNNTYGQLGDNSELRKVIPVQVIGLTDIVAIRAGRYYSLALKKDGTVWAWGRNEHGQLGLGDNNQRNVAEQIPDLYGVLQIDAKRDHVLALKSNSTIWSWGSNDSGQLGEGSLTDRNSPVRVTGLTNVKQIEAGGAHSLALDNIGRVWAWGSNNNGQLGINSTSRKLIPVSVIDDSDLILTGITDIAAGGSHSLAVSSSGTVFSWGRNANGQLGDGTDSTHNVAAEISGLTNIETIQAAGDSSFAVNTSGEFYNWGYNHQGQLGMGTVIDTYNPELWLDMTQQGHVVTTLNLTAKRESRLGANHGVSVAIDGSVWAWGYNDSGQLGDGSFEVRLSPVHVTGLTNIIAASAGGYHTLALKKDGTVWAWGGNYYGQLGDNSKIRKTAPVQVIGLTDIVAIRAGEYHSLALKNDGTVWSWGKNDLGQLGSGDNNQRSIAELVPVLNGVKQIDTKGDHVLVLKSNGTVWSWGYNSDGQLGEGSSTARNSPVRVSGLTNIKQVEAGFDNHSLALDNAGGIWAWGSNINGQLGINSSTSSNTPVSVIDSSGNLLTGMTSIAAGGSHSLAVSSSGSVFSWGSNTDGQLGNGPDAIQNVAVEVGGMTDVEFVQAARNSSFSVHLNSDLSSWGYNRFGQLGTENDINISLPQLTYINIISKVYSVTLTVGTGGSSSSEQTQIIGHSGIASFVLNPDAGYEIDTVSGSCASGPLSGNIYTTGFIDVDCSVVVSFKLSPVDGFCGASDGLYFIDVPTENLCTSGVVSDFSGIGPWSWECQGKNGGGFESCSTIIESYTVTSNFNSGGNVTPSSQSVNLGGTASFTVTPAKEFALNSLVGGSCPEGSWSGDVYNTGLIEGDCSVEFNFDLRIPLSAIIFLLQ